MLALLVVGAGCGSSQGVTPDGNDGSGTATGMIGDRAFESVADARWIGAPDDPKQTRVIYVFDKQVSCAALSSLPCAKDEDCTSPLKCAVGSGKCAP